MAQTVKHLPTMQETWVRSLGREDALEKVMATHSSTLAWKIHGWRNVVGYSSWGRKESDMTEQIHFHFHPMVLVLVGMTILSTLNSLDSQLQKLI